jgi:DNA gyrase/topoisomerase IV subunit B
MGDNDNVVVGIDQVRQRPGMWVGKTGLTGRQCLLWALVSNSVDQVA